ncbi:MAG: ThiF family adenylyltransferase, partial [Deltaproteobacteria bacterium]
MITIRPRKGEAGGEDRYARLREIPWWEQEVLAAARVIVVGAGALGNEVLKNLALLGIGSITIVDHDRIETSNLTRSVLFRRGDVGAWKAEVARDRVVEMNPDCRVEALSCDVIFDLGLGRFRRADVVFGCLDNLAARFFLNKFCYRTKTPYLDAALDHLNGDVRIFVPPEGACYECGMSEHDRRTLRKRVSCLKTALPPIERHIPTTPTISAI